MRPFVILFMALLWSAPVLAQSRASEKEWNSIIEGAKKEGKVVVAGSPDPVMRNEIIPKFTARYGIPIEFIAGRSSEISARSKNRARRPGFTASMFISPARTPPATTLYGEKMIDPLKPLLVMPEVADGTKWKRGKIWFVDPEERFVVRAFSSVATLLFINTEQVKPEEMRSARTCSIRNGAAKFPPKIPRPPAPAPTRRRGFITISAKISCANSTSSRRLCARASGAR